MNISKASLIFCLVLTAAWPGWVAAQVGETFWSYWGDGKAEINSFEVSVPRYGTNRSGYDALIFVTEDFDREKQVKNDSKKSTSVSALKLNHVRRFQTGIYDYALMLSVFEPLEGNSGALSPAPLKTSLAVTEWCGNYFEQLNRKGAVVVRQQRSYFESEGDTESTLTIARDAIFEDDLLIRVREITGKFKAGNYPIITSSLYGRLQKFQPALVSARVERSVVEGYDTIFGKKPVVEYRIAIDGRTLTVVVLNEGARQIVGWERTFKSGDTEAIEKADLIRSERLPYWSLQGESGAEKRAEMKLPAIK